LQRSPGVPARPIQEDVQKQAGNRAYAPFDTQLHISTYMCDHRFMVWMVITEINKISYTELSVILFIISVLLRSKR